MTPTSFAAVLAADLSLPDGARPIIADAITTQIEAYKPQTRPKEECRHVVRLDIRIDRVVVRDQFEWDLSANNDPDTFAEALCADLGLETRHVPALAHAIREQIAELSAFRHNRAGCPTVTERTVFRKTPDVWAPTVECLTPEETERLERKERREARLQRRNRGKADIYSRPTTSRRRSSASSRTR